MSPRELHGGRDRRPTTHADDPARVDTRRLSCAALVVREAAGKPYRTLLACVDTSPAAVQALRRAMALAPEARVHVVHAHEPPLWATLRRLRLHAQAAAHLTAEQTRVRAALAAALKGPGCTSVATPGTCCGWASATCWSLGWDQVTVLVRPEDGRGPGGLCAPMTRRAVRGIVGP